MPKTNYPVDADKKILINLVKTELQHESYKEILQAFKDATKGSFDIDLTTYGVFSYAYMNRVLKAYKQWLMSSRKIKELPDAPKEITPEQNLAALKRNCKHIFEELNKGVEAGKILIQPSTYNILKDNGLIQTKKWPKVEGYKSWQEQCSNEYLKLNPKKEIYEPITTEGARNDGMKMAVIYTIQAMIKEKANSEILEIIEELKWVK
jgi:N12 class adenine-specific DNA methylase